MIRNSSGSLVCDPFVKAEDYRSRFASHSTPVSPTLPSSPHASNHVFPSALTARRMHQLLYDLNVSKPAGPDGIPPIGLKIFAPEVSPVLYHLFLLLTKLLSALQWRSQLFFLSQNMEAVLNTTAIDPSSSISWFMSLGSCFPRLIASVSRSRRLAGWPPIRILLARFYRQSINCHPTSAALDDHEETYLVSLDFSKTLRCVLH